VAYLESGLAKAGVRGKVVPPADIIRGTFEQQVKAGLRAAVAAEWAGRVEAEAERRFENSASRVREAASGLVEGIPARLTGYQPVGWRDVVAEAAAQAARDATSRAGSEGHAGSPDCGSGPQR
jgi:hypothetical protein